MHFACLGNPTHPAKPITRNQTANANAIGIVPIGLVD